MANDHPFGPETYDDVDRWQKEYTPERSGQLPGPDALADGSYEFEVIQGELTRTQKTQESIFKLQLRVLTGAQAGLMIERATFFRSKNNVDYLGGDMITLGFPADKWTSNGKSLSQNLTETAAQLKGIRFQGAKTTKKAEKPGDKDLHTIWINARSTGKPMPIQPSVSGATPGFNEFKQPAAAAPAGSTIPW